MKIILTQLEWPSASISNEPDDGLWDNAGKTAIHIPHFQFSLNKNYKNLDFYYSYDDDYVSRAYIFYIDLNDIVFSNKVWSGINKIKIFFATRVVLINTLSSETEFIPFQRQCHDT